VVMFFYRSLLSMEFRACWGKESFSSNFAGYCHTKLGILQARLKHFIKHVLFTKNKP
jgi:hypothetical protein